MKVNMAIEWEKAPDQGRVVIANGEILSSCLNIGWGTYDKNKNYFNFSERENKNCRLTFYIDSETIDSETAPTTISVVDTEKPFSFLLKDVLSQSPLALAGYGVQVHAEEDVWGNL